MYYARSRRTLTIWMAALAILFSALVPSVSHALSLAMGRSDALWSPICSTSGAKLLPGTAADVAQKPVKDLQLHMEHCPYCATHDGSWALPPPALTTFAVVGGHDLFPSLYYQAPAAMFAWSAAQPRGPPTLS